jgi:hypothetical protein
LIVHEKSVVEAETSLFAEIKKLSACLNVTILYARRTRDADSINNIVNQEIRRYVFLLEHASPTSNAWPEALRRARFL